jgi:hypothetical protein
VLADDLTVAAGATLTLGRANGSLQPIRVETTGDGVLILVQGTLMLQGPVSFATYDRGTDPAAWKGLEIASSGSLVTNGHSLRIRNAETALTMTGSGQSLEFIAEYCTNGLVLHGGATLGEGSRFASVSGTAVDAVDADVRFTGGFEITSGPGLTVDAADDRVLIEGGLSTIFPLIFTSRLASPAAGDWTGLKIIGSLTSSGPWTIEYATYGVEHAGTVSLSDMTFRNCVIGVLANGSSGDLTLTDSSFDTMGQWGIVRGNGGDLTLGNVSFSDVVEAAIEMNGGVFTVTDPVTADECAGVNLTNLGAGSVVEDITMTNSSGVPLAISGGTLSLGPAVVVDGSGAGMPGIQITDGAAVTLAGSVSAQHCALHGLLVIGSTLSGTWADLTAQYNGSSGLRVEGRSVSLGSGTVLSHNALGLYLLDADATVLDATLDSNSGSGVVAEGTSDVDVQSSRIRNNSTGVLIGDQATATLGVSCGHNSFAGNTYKYVANLHTGLTVEAVGNYWGACPPKATKFMGMVNHENCLFCEDDECTAGNQCP